MDTSKLGFLDKTIHYFDGLNNSKYIAGLSLLVLNLGSKYMAVDITKTQDQIMAHKIFRRFVIFTIFFVGTHDILVSIIMTACFIIFASNILSLKQILRFRREI